MITYEHFLAIALLMAPPGTKEPALDPPLEGRVRSALQTLAVQLEILDPNETRYTLARPEDFAADLDLLRKRYEEFADAPFAAEAMRFPERNVVTELLSFNRAYRERLEASQPMHNSRWWEVRSALTETDQLYEVWDKIRDARCTYQPVTARRRALKALREMLGYEAYYKGEMPPYVPLWRFQMVD